MRKTIASLEYQISVRDEKINELINDVNHTRKVYDHLQKLIDEKEAIIKSLQGSHRENERLKEQNHLLIHDHAARITKLEGETK